MAFDDDEAMQMKWKDSGETGSPHVFKVDDIAYNKQVFPVVAATGNLYVRKMPLFGEDKR